MVRQERICKPCGHTWDPMNFDGYEQCPKCGSMDTKQNCFHLAGIYVDVKDEFPSDKVVAQLKRTTPDGEYVDMVYTWDDSELRGILFKEVQKRVSSECFSEWLHDGIILSIDSVCDGESGEFKGVILTIKKRHGKVEKEGGE